MIGFFFGFMVSRVVWCLWCFGVLAPVADRRARARDAIATPRGASARRVIRLVRCRASDGWQAMD